MPSTRRGLPLFLALSLGSSAALAQGAPPPPPGMTALPPPVPGPPAPPPLPTQPPPVWQPAAPPPGWQPAGPPQGWQSPPPQQAWQSPPGPIEYPTPPPAAPEVDAAPAGLPLDLHGAIGLDTASYTDLGDAFTSIAIRLLASVPVARGVYVDARLPMGFTTDKTTNATLGNVIVGAHGVFPVGKTTWMSLGGGLGLPLLSGGTERDRGFGGPQVPNAFWNIHEYMPSAVPIELRATIEGEAGPVTIRGELAPAFMFPIGNNKEIEVAIMHSIEAQVGHTIGGGLRLQGVALPTFGDVYRATAAQGDLYQLAMEPFFAVQRPRYYFRSGVMMPLDSTLGPPFSRSFGFRLGFGVRLD
ncbi:MAG: hypothetical protein ABJE95_37975 [Byssovorax sp.]